MPATELADQVEGRGLVGKDIFWERDRRDILSDLDQLLRRDHRREIRGAVMSVIRWLVPGKPRALSPSLTSTTFPCPFRLILAPKSLSRAISSWSVLADDDVTTVAPTA